MQGDVGDGELVGRVIKEHDVNAVVHFAGSVIVPESIENPLKYYRNNTCASRNLIQACVNNNVRHFVFSSSAAVYGMPQSLPVSEDAPTVPISPYGLSKLMTEWILRDASSVHELSYVALRYFNVAGADPAGRTGQSTPDATHLIKVASQAVVGRRDAIEIFGEDYDTPDGTCIRDYIHVSDLAASHVKALQTLIDKNENLVLNCGYGHGYSVREVLDAVVQEAGDKLAIRSGPRRPGDPPSLVADVARIRKCLDWQPRYDDLHFIVRTAIEWEKKLGAES